MRLKRATTPDAMEATDKLVMCDRRDSQLRMLWRRHTNFKIVLCDRREPQRRMLRRRQTNLTWATEESSNSGCFRSDATLDALEATDHVSCGTDEIRYSGCFGSDRQTCPVRPKKLAPPDALEATLLCMLWRRHTMYSCISLKLSDQIQQRNL